MNLLAYIADIVILVTYFLMARGKPAKWFHLANGLGCIPLLVVEAVQHAYPPMLLTGTFGIIGWVGVLTPSGKDATL